MNISRRKILAMTAGASALAMPAIRRAHAEDAVLNVYNWADYIGETTIEDFQSATGIAVTYDTYSSAEEVNAKMLAGKTGYDVVDVASTSAQRMVQAGILQKLDKSKLPSWNNLDPEIMRILDGLDPGVQYSMPYMWGSVGFTFNVDMVKERFPEIEMDNLDFLFKPENVAKLADCGISILDTSDDVLMLAMSYLGIDPYTKDVSQYQKVVEAFKPIRQHIKTFDNTNYLNAIPNKELCVINNWSGDYATAKARAAEAGVELNLEYHVPKTGSPAWIDTMVIPADAAHPENAHKFIEYLLQPEVIAKCTNYTNYANANVPAKKFIDAAVLENPAVYPDAETMKRLYPPQVTNEEQDRELTRALQAIKTGT
jgi:putrescine transport system substrate-binding protein